MVDLHSLTVLSYSVLKPVSEFGSKRKRHNEWYFPFFWNVRMAACQRLVTMPFWVWVFNKKLFDMEKIRTNVGGIDIGAKKVFTSIEGQPVVSHFTFTEDFYVLRDYLLGHQVKSIAMEATGVYWVILYEILEEAGIDVWLVDGRQTKQVPGRKTDVKDCQWIQELHSYGLLNRCLVVEADIKELRGYLRLREDHINSSSMHINQMQKALTLMNIRLKEVLSQIHGASGLAIIEAILRGERDRQVLVSMCHRSVLKNKKELVLKALEGRYTESGLFALRQAYEGYRFYLKQIDECDKRINVVINRIGQSGTGQELKKNEKLSGTINQTLKNSVQTC